MATSRACVLCEVSPDDLRAQILPAGHPISSDTPTGLIINYPPRWGQRWAAVSIQLAMLHPLTPPTICRRRTNTESPLKAPCRSHRSSPEEGDSPYPHMYPSEASFRSSRLQFEWLFGTYVAWWSTENQGNDNISLMRTAWNVKNFIWVLRGRFFLVQRCTFPEGYWRGVEGPWRRKGQCRGISRARNGFQRFSRIRLCDTRGRCLPRFLYLRRGAQKLAVRNQRCSYLGHFQRKRQCSTIEIIRRLLKCQRIHFYDTNELDGNALHIATERKDRTLETITGHVKGVNARSSNGNTPLQNAIVTGSVRKFLCLLRAGAKIHRRYNDYSAQRPRPFNFAFAKRQYKVAL